MPKFCYIIQIEQATWVIWVNPTSSNTFIIGNWYVKRKEITTNLRMSIMNCCHMLFRTNPSLLVISYKCYQTHKLYSANSTNQTSNTVITVDGVKFQQFMLNKLLLNIAIPKRARLLTRVLMEALLAKMSAYLTNLVCRLISPKHQQP